MATNNGSNGGAQPAEAGNGDSPIDWGETVKKRRAILLQMEIDQKSGELVRIVDIEDALRRIVDILKGIQEAAIGRLSREDSDWLSDLFNERLEAFEAAIPDLYKDPPTRRGRGPDRQPRQAKAVRIQR